MRSRCEELRERALTAGLASPSTLAWRAHCRSCPNCRTELFVLETLERQAAEERCHLARREVAELLRTAQELYPRQRPGAASLQWSFRVVCLCMVLLVFGGLRRCPWSASQPSGGAVHPGSGAVAHGSKLAALGPAPATAATGVMSWSATGPDGAIDRKVQDVRQRLEMRRGQLLEMIEAAHGERSRHDAWFMSGPAAPAWG